MMESSRDAPLYAAGCRPEVCPEWGSGGPARAGKTGPHIVCAASSGTFPADSGHSLV